MANNGLIKLYQEKSALLDEWRKASGRHKMKILIRLIDIDDEISESDRGGGLDGFGGRKRRPLSPVFQKKKSF